MIVSSFVVAVDLLGCVNVAYEMNYPIDDTTPGASLTDSRNSEGVLAETEVLSVGGMNCGYAVYRIGEGNLVPSRLRYLESRLDHATIGVDRVELVRFDVFLNLQTVMRHGVTSANSTHGPNWIAGMLSGSSCVADETMPGGFSLSDNANYDPAAVVTLEMNIDGERLVSRAVYAQPLERFEGIRDKRVAGIIERAITRAVDQVVAETAR
ncbi:MAG: hypothetical protein NXI30_02585 [bacterium]|nr:hypothetical protein [bacterium]